MTKNNEQGQNIRTRPLAHWSDGNTDITGKQGPQQEDPPPDEKEENGNQSSS